MVLKCKIREDGRIVALRDFGTVQTGDVGGFVESENNLSHDGATWVADSAQAPPDTQVAGDAQVSGNARVLDTAQVSGGAWAVSLSDRN